MVKHKRHHSSESSSDDKNSLKRRAESNSTAVYHSSHYSSRHTASSDKDKNRSRQKKHKSHVTSGGEKIDEPRREKRYSSSEKIHHVRKHHYQQKTDGKLYTNVDRADQSPSTSSHIERKHRNADRDHRRDGRSIERNGGEMRHGGKERRNKRNTTDEHNRGRLRNMKFERSDDSDKRKSLEKVDKFGSYLRGDFDKEEPNIVKEKPNFEPSGKLIEDTNMYRGVVIKYNEPPDAHMPKTRWRLYPFKDEQTLQVLYIHRQSAYLIGRDRRIADLPVDHPSCSKQHAVFQYRLTSLDLPDGTIVKRVRPYIIDLGSANGTYLNGDRLDAQRYVELREKDVLRFGFSTREFVLLNEKSYEHFESDVKKEEVSPTIKKEESPS